MRGSAIALFTWWPSWLAGQLTPVPPFDIPPCIVTA